eukprot:6327896-Pyramimonas_sp.AAC.1
MVSTVALTLVVMNPVSALSLLQRKLPLSIPCAARSGAHGRALHRSGETVDVKGSTVDVKGSTVDVKDSTVDVKGSTVDVKDSTVDVKGSAARFFLQRSALGWRPLTTGSLSSAGCRRLPSSG